jgi:hypothetical protein
VGPEPALPPPPGALGRQAGHDDQHPAAPYGRWCPYCGADLSHVPIREEPPEEAVFAAVGRRLKTALAVGFVLVWMIVSLYDWLSEPAALVVPAWFSALGAFLLLVVLLGIQPWAWMGGRRR